MILSSRSVDPSGCIPPVVGRSNSGFDAARQLVVQCRLLIFSGLLGPFLFVHSGIKFCEDVGKYMTPITTFVDAYDYQGKLLV